MRLLVLMYHKIQPATVQDDLIISVEKFEEQLRYLTNNGFNTISLSQLTAYVTAGAALPPKPVLLTFDDGYRNNLLYGYPLLKKYRMKANIFLIGNKVNPQQQNAGEYLDTADLKSMDSALVEYGLHSFAHGNYGEMTPAEIAKDITATQHRFKQLGIPYQPCFAYPYGAYGRTSQQQQNDIEAIFKQLGIQIGFRIGNRLNRLPLKKKYLIQRVDVKGTKPLWEFKVACNIGSKWLPW